MFIINQEHFKRYKLSINAMLSLSTESIFVFIRTGKS